MEGFAFQSLISPPPGIEEQPGIWLCVGVGTVLVSDDERASFIEATHPRELGIEVDHQHFLGVLDGRPVWAAGIDSPGEVPGLRFENLYALSAAVPETSWALAGRAVQIAEWDRTHRFCGRCGAATDPAPGERARRCPACGLLAFPRLAPAVITLVEKGDEALLANGRAFGRPVYSALAGFVEPGETIEETVHREVREEVGIEVKDVTYRSSQPWPFPHSLMLGFSAQWASGEIDVDQSEIVDAKWFRPDSLPSIPGGVTIARRLIDAWLAKHGVTAP